MWTKISVIGLGNILLRDEGIGVHVVEALRKDFDFSQDFRLLDGGTLGLDLLPYVEGTEKILFVDAIDLQKEPGTIAIIEDEEIPSCLKPALSFHEIGLADLLFAAKFVGIKPPKVTLIGIQPEKIEMGLTLSDTLSENFGKLLNTILEKLREWGVEFKEKNIKGPADVRGYSL
ncbi:MAG: HyaD/HybD family hydrogenase maturation endopeptidase [Deltaproteobacteria bacterium]|nr:HyaD/HybD family hydrogenase maturation endopeptidase [Deltaproteobacteria bacterium]